jgi:methionine-rich copper-binding protein CopC
MPHRYKWRLAALFGLSAVWLLLLCGTAFAHARLEETYPADGDTLADPPEQVQLRFNEPVEAEFDPVEVYDQEGTRVDEDDARESPDDRRLLVVDLDELREGIHTVEWRVTSADGHPVSGTYEFGVDASAMVSDAAEPIEPVERSAEQEETGWTWGGILTAVLGVLLVGALVGAGLTFLFRREGTV